jgi:transposase-like protein
MTVKNKYLNHSHISEKKFRQIVMCFVKDFTVTETAQLTEISRVSISNIYQKIRIRIVKLCQDESPVSGEVEIDESYFGAKRVRGKRGRGAKGKIPVFGLLKRSGKVYTTIIKNCKKEQLLPIIKGKILEGSTIYSDSWKSYDGLVLNGYKHYRIYHSKNEFARGKNHINGIESFWSFTKRRLAKFNGISKSKFLLHLKESEFRFNNKGKNLYKLLLENFRKDPL